MDSAVPINDISYSGFTPSDQLIDEWSRHGSGPWIHGVGTLFHNQTRATQVNSIIDNDTSDSHGRNHSLTIS